MGGRHEIKIIREIRELIIRDRRWSHNETEKNIKYNTRETGIE